jgi:molecular chaperone HscA
LEARRLAEAKVEAERIALATQKALTTDVDLLEAGEGARVERSLASLREVLGGTNASTIRNRIDELDHVTHEWAGRRMNRAVARAIEGKNLGVVEASVAAAKGVAAHLAEQGHGSADHAHHDHAHHDEASHDTHHAK